MCASCPCAPYGVLADAKLFGDGAVGQRALLLQILAAVVEAAAEYPFNMLPAVNTLFNQAARRFKGSTSEHLIGLLERDLDCLQWPPWARRARRTGKSPDQRRRTAGIQEECSLEIPRRWQLSSYPTPPLSLR